MMEIHPDKRSFETIWTDLVEKEIRNYKREYADFIQIIPNEKEEVWKKYKFLNAYCKTNYMKALDGKLDRHKVAACYLIAIATIKPMRFCGILEESSEEVYDVINERLAITVAFSLLRAFAVAAIHENKECSEEQKECLIKKFENGIFEPFSNLVNHGEYVSNYAREIHYAVEEGNINTLSVAHELYLLELLTHMAE